MSKHKQLLFLFFRELCSFFSCSWSDVCLFLFLLIFPAFIDQTSALHQVFLLTVCTTGVKILRKYLCPLTVARSENASSGCLQKVTNNGKSLKKVVAVTYRRCLFTRGSDFKALTQKVLVFWIGSC